MPPALIGGAIAGIGSIGGSIIANKGVNNATKAAQKSADQALAYQRETRDQNTATLAPYVQQGLPATNQINALLGLGGSAATPGKVDWSAYVNANPDAMADWQRYHNDMSQADYGQYHYGADGSRRDLTPFTSGGTGAVSAADAQAAAQQGFDTFRNSTGYQFRLGEGLKGVNSGYAGAGTVKSGAAMKGINDYAQGMASGEFGNYMNSLLGQQGVGLSAASATAGVGQNFANNAANIAMNNGDNMANAALLRAQNTGQLVNSLASIGSGIAGNKSLFKGY